MIRAKRAKTPLIVGFPSKQKPGKLGALHRKFGIRQAEKLDIIQGYSIDVPTEEVDHYLESLPTSARVMIDGPLFDAPPKESRISAESKVVDGLEDPHLETPYLSRPAGLAKLHAQGFQGQGTTIAVVDSGLAQIGDFDQRVKHFKSFNTVPKKKPSDSNGHGTHVTGIAAGDGLNIDGIAPKADIVGLQISSALEAIKAIEWAVENKEKYGIDVLNVSLGVPDRLSHRQDPFAQATQKAIDSGIITVVAAGNEGRDCQLDDLNGLCNGTISSPGILPDAITVGAFDDGGTVGLKDDKVWARSSAGPTASDQSAKPDLVAPGVNVLAPTAPKSVKSRSRPTWNGHHFDNGSSMAAPMVSGAVALMLQVHPGLTQREAKDMLIQTAVPIANTSTDVQGAGRLNLKDLMEEARSL